MAEKNETPAAEDETKDTPGVAAMQAAERAASAVPSNRDLVSYRVLPMGHDKVFTGEHQTVELTDEEGEPTGEFTVEHTKHPKGTVVDGVPRRIASKLEARGYVEILG